MKRDSSLSSFPRFLSPWMNELDRGLVKFGAKLLQSERRLEIDFYFWKENL